MASANGHADIVRLLLERGAVRANNCVRSALVPACSLVFLDSKVLAERGVTKSRRQHALTLGLSQRADTGMQRSKEKVKRMANSCRDN